MKKQLPVIPTKKELAGGLIYLAFELLLLPVLLNLLGSLLPVSLSAGQQNGIFFLVNFLSLVWIFRRFLAASWRYFLSSPLPVLIAAVLGFSLYWVASAVMDMLIVALYPDFSNVNDTSIMKMAESDFAIIAFGTVVLVPIAEELIFRGSLFSGLYNRSRLAAFLISTALFSVIHITGYIGLYPAKHLLLCALQYLPAGLVLGWSCAASGSILTPIAIHTAINTVGIFAMR